MELQNTVQVFSQEDKVMSMCSVDEGSNNMVAMLNDLRAFCTSKEQETIDMLADMFSMLENLRNHLQLNRKEFLCPTIF